MKELNKWAKDATYGLSDPTTVECYKLGALQMRQKVLNIIHEQEQLNSENIKNHPELANYLLLEISNLIKNLGEKEVDSN